MRGVLCSGGEHDGAAVSGHHLVTDPPAQRDVRLVSGLCMPLEQVFLPRLTAGKGRGPWGTQAAGSLPRVPPRIVLRVLRARTEDSVEGAAPQRAIFPGRARTGCRPLLCLGVLRSLGFSVVPQAHRVCSPLLAASGLTQD